MLPSRHIIVTLPLSVIVWSLTQSTLAGLLCFVAGVLVDIDHYIDYIIHFGWRGSLSLNNVYRSCVKLAQPEADGGTKKLYLFFHAIEFAVLLWMAFAVTNNILLFSIALAYTGHLTLDLAANGIEPKAYFIVWRIKNNFTKPKLIKSLYGVSRQKVRS